MPDGVSVATPRPKAVGAPVAQPGETPADSAVAPEATSEAAPAPVAAGETVDGAKAKPRVAHYTQYTIRLHENSSVTLTDLQNILQERVDAAEGQEMKTSEGSKRFKGTIFTIAPKGKARASAEERLAKQAAKFRAAAEKAGLDPNALLTAAPAGEAV